MIKWSGCKKGVYTGTVESPSGIIEFNVEKSLTGMHFKSKLGNSFISNSSTLEDAKERCLGYYLGLKL